MINITYFVHGTTTDNEQHIATGWLPGQLSELGIQQSHDLAGRVANQDFDVVICSDLKRAVDTTEIAFGKKHKILQDKRLREANYGDWNGKPDSLFKYKVDQFINTTYPNGESYVQVEARIRSLCNELKEKYEGKRVALLAHQAPQIALEVIANGKTWQQAFEEDWRKTGSYQPGWHYVLK